MSNRKLKKSTSRVGEVVSQVTVKALQEFETGPLTPEQLAEGEGADAEAEPAPGDGTEDAAEGEQPAAVEKPPSRPISAKSGSRPGSGKPGSRPGSATQKPPSRTGSGGSAGKDRPASGKGSVAERLSQQGSRPGSGKAGSERPGSGKAGSERPGSGKAGSGRPGSGKAGSDRPASGRPGSGRPGSGKPASASKPDEAVPEGAGQERGPDDAADVPPQPAEQGTGAGEDFVPDFPPPDEPQNDDLLNFDFGGTGAGALTGGGGGGGGDDGDDGGDGGDDEDDEEEEEEGGVGPVAVGGESDDGSDGEGEMVVLDPDHPLMKRFQTALKSHLLKQDEKVTLELRELTEALKDKRKTREDIGVELYGVQQELARHQMMLEKKHDEFATLSNERTQAEQNLGDIRDMYKETQLTVNKDKKKNAELQSEVEHLALRIFYMENAKEDVRSDIAVMRRAAEKADSEVSKSEALKQKQDLFVDRLVERVDKLKEEIAMYEAQISAQSEETKAAREALTEAHMEIEAINMEKKQLLQQWNSSLIGMRRRDEAHAAMMEALNQQEQRILSLETEIEGYKKSIFKEQEQNEKLTLILNKAEIDIATLRKQMAVCQQKHEALKSEYATYTRMLHETEQALNRANAEKQTKLNELNALRKQIEREYLEKVRLEDEIMEMMRQQLTMDKASQYTEKLTGKLRDRTKELEAQSAEVENQIARDGLELSNVNTRIENLKHIMDDLNENIRQKNAIISRSENEMIKRNAIIERKQNLIDQYNKKLEVLISSAGGVELGPLEIQINSLLKSIDAQQQEIAELQQMWLRQQSELVRLTREREEQSLDVETRKKQLVILTQKKMRIESEIEQERRDIGEIEKDVSNMHNDMLKLNMLLHKEKGMEEQLHQSNALMETDFILQLKESEMNSIQMQSKLDALKEEKERLLNSLVEAERQIMLWEKKAQLAKETRAAVDSEVGQGEIRAMKAEIHRMQVRYTQLMKQQEKMIQEMEKAVSRRDTIVTRGDAQSKMHKKVLTKGTFQRQLAELRKKIKQTVQDASGCDQEIRQLREHQQQLSQQLEDRQTNCQQLQGKADELDVDVERLYEQKQKNLSELLSKQQRAKYYQQAKDGKYTRICKSDAALDSELEKQKERLYALSAIVDRLNQEFPHVQPALRKVTVALGSKMMHDEDQ
ncbi:coiled-coil domain-containing protein 40 isoform X1 [Lingula anatina]|uniref:Coiled-coil domain-containing protein 40 isoform X1 n=1 Tax=Lingula anatina TaxID=7574 RepID=A0A1S3JGJ6_LINAN|nr:coiled-coil domain-containing protein 40 isoform X1 [Lingula anatina]|eukprot:XP_013409019.1 coiled-coil domain-containing protein 40 isoform X1 [Lingula anatina]